MSLLQDETSTGYLPFAIFLLVVALVLAGMYGLYWVAMQIGGKLAG
jgi:hypothetical protein